MRRSGHVVLHLVVSKCVKTFFSCIQSVSYFGYLEGHIVCWSSIHQIYSLDNIYILALSEGIRECCQALEYDPRSETCTYIVVSHSQLYRISGECLSHPGSTPGPLLRTMVVKPPSSTCTQKPFGGGACSSAVERS